MSELKKAVEAAGGPMAVSKACEVSVRAVYKWLSTGSLPRTDYTGETRHGAKVVALAESRGVLVDLEQLLASARPGKAAA